jgi:hypothetical protein
VILLAVGSAPASRKPTSAEQKSIRQAFTFFVAARGHGEARRPRPRLLTSTQTDV